MCVCALFIKMTWGKTKIHLGKKREVGLSGARRGDLDWTNESEAGNSKLFHDCLTKQRPGWYSCTVLLCTLHSLRVNQGWNKV